jgi:putative oxidoreductase
MKTLLLLRFFRPLAPLGWPLLRIAVGALLALQGWQKVSIGPLRVANDLAALGVPVPEIAAWACIAVELGGGALLVLGLFARPAALAVLLMKAASVFYAHHAALDVLGSPAGGVAEYPLLLAVAALAILFRGAGALSLDGTDDGGN